MNREVIAILLIAASGILFFVIMAVVMVRFLKNRKETKPAGEDDKLFRRVSAARELVAPDGVDPNPLSYFLLNDAGHDVYVRCFTIDALPKRTAFATTFPALFNCGRMRVSVFIEPLPESRAAHMLDTTIVEIETNIISAEKNYNRNMLRKLNGKLRETEGWAERIETGENSLYHVYFLFVLMTSSLEELNYESDSFRNLAKEKQITVSACYGVQPEAFLSGMPLNRRVNAGIGPVRTAGLKRHTMDKLSISSIFNHTQIDFIHENGVVLGRNMSSWKPVAYDCYDTSHNGYNVVFCGMTGTGKSATMKILASRYISKNGYRFVSIDSQARGNRGEYAMMADVQCGINYQIKVDSEIILNPFEVREEEEWSEIDGDYIVLRLKDKIEDASGNLMIMVQGNKGPMDFELTTYLERIMTDITAELYEERGIINGQVDSLFEEGVQELELLGSGKRRKTLPTMTDFYKKVLIKDRENEIREHKKAYRILLDSLKERVRELYYCPKCLRFFAREEYETLNHTCKCEANGHKIQAIQGVKSYFDGQSNVVIDNNVKFTNIDLSQLPEEERAVARLIALSFVTEHFIKKNAINPKKMEYMGVICDELHENFKSLPAVQKLDYVSRTSRKRLVSLWTATQALQDYKRMPETEALLKQAATKFVFKQDYQDRSWVKEALNLTNGQADRILELGGDPSDQSEDRKGEVCIVDNGKVCFCKVDYLKSAEAVFVETDARTLQAMYGGEAG
ncbi:MAG: hypothetical protein J1E98_08660 [Lachnospiraceae bacterium]|nr:hypothetical protein [Lachnospiraceae bacterium]